MTGPALPPIDAPPWTGGVIGAGLECVLAPNPSPMTLDGTNTWVVAGSGGVVVLDPGPEDVAHLDRIGRRTAGHGRVREVLLTHGHADHSAGAVALADRLGVGVRALDPAHRYGSEGLEDGDVIDLGDRELRVVATPGHTHDSLSFLHSTGDGRDLLTGDTVLGRGTAVIAHPDGVLGPYLDSLRRLAALVDSVGQARVLPGHGPVLADAGSVLHAYLDHRSQRLEQVRAAVEAGARNPRRVLEIAYADVPRAMWPAAELSVRAQLRYLAEQGVSGLGG